MAVPLRPQAGRRDRRLGPPRGRLRTDLLYLGWRPADPLPDPGPPPLPPPMPALAEVSPDWLAAQRRERYVLFARPAWIAGGTGTLVSALGAACWLGAFGPPGLAAATVVAGLVVAGASLRSDARSRTRLRAQLAAEGERVGQIRAVQQAQHAARTAEHASRSREWQQRQAEATRQPGWRPAVVPVAVDRIDVAGGTLRGWTALLTMLAAPRLAAAPSDRVDLTEGAVALTCWRWRPAGESGRWSMCSRMTCRGSTSDCGCRPTRSRTCWRSPPRRSIRAGPARLTRPATPRCWPGC